MKKIVNKADIKALLGIDQVKAAKELWHADTKADLAKLSERWKPYRSLAAYYLWHYYLSKKNQL